MTPEVLLTIGGDVSALNAAIDNALSRPRSIRGINANTFTEPLGRITGKASEFSKSLEASNARVVAFGASAGAIFAVQKAFAGLLTSTIEVEKSINGIGTILGTTSSNLRAISNELFKVASLTGQSFSAAAEAAQEFARQGLNAEEMILRTRDALILARISGMDFANSAKAITTAINAFSSEMLTSTDVVNRLSAADTNFAVSSKDLADALARVGSTAEDSNVSLNQTVALVTAAAQITGRTGAVIGNAFKSMFTRLERPKVLDDLESVGVKIRDTQGSILPTIEILKNLAMAYDSLTPSQQSFASETVGSVYQINTLKAVLKDLGSGFSIYDSVLKTVSNSTGSAIARNEQLNQTLSAKLLATMNSITQAGSKIGELVISPTLSSGAGLATGFFDGISKALDAEGFGGDIARGIFKGIGNILGGPGVQFVTFAMLKLFQNLSIFAAKAVGEFTGVQSKAKQMELTQVQVLTELARQPAVLQAIRAGTISIDAAARQVFNDIRAQNTALEAQLGLARLIAKAGVNAGLTVQGTRYKAAAGYVPNFNSDFAMEEAQAKSLGAKNPRAHYGKGKIGGRPFIMNSEEVEIPNFGSNGDSAVIPRYAEGMVPNFADLYRSALAISKSRSFSTILSKKLADEKDIFKASYNLVRLKETNDEVTNLAKLNRTTKGRQAEILAKKYFGKNVIDFNDENKTSPFDLMLLKDLIEVRGRGNIRGTPLVAKAARYISENGRFKTVRRDGRQQTEKLGKQFTLVALADSKLPSGFETAAAGHFPNFAQTMPVADAFFQFTPTSDFKRTQDYLAQEVPATGQFIQRLLQMGATNIKTKLTRNFSKGGSYPGYDSVVSAVVNGVLKKYLVSVKAGSARNTLSDLGKINRQMALGLQEPEIQAIQGEIVKVLAMRDTLPSVSKAGKYLKSKALAKGFLPNFAAVTGGKFYDFDETLVRYPKNINPRELFFPQSIKKASLTPLGKSLKGSTDPINILTARDLNSKKAIEQFLEASQIPFNKVITSAGMFKNLKIQGKRGMRGLNSAEKKAQFLSNLYEKTGVSSSLIDDAMANIDAVRALGNPNITAEHYKTHGQRGLGQSFKASGLVPNFAALSFKKEVDEFGVTNLTGYLGKNKVGDLGYSGKGVREIEGFDIDEKYRGKGYAKQFYSAMGKGKTKGTLLPNYDENGRVFFPQLSRARSAKKASISQYGSAAQMTLAQFNELVQKNISNKKFWDANTFELMTSHASGFIPNFVSQNAIDAMKRMAGYTGKDPTLIAQANVAKSKLAQAVALSATDRQYMMTHKDAIMAGMGQGFAQNFNIDALELGDLKYATKSGLPMQIAEALSRIVKKQGGRSALSSLLRWGSFAGGHIPNFSAVQDAVNREMDAGYSRSQVRIGQDMSLKSAHNPDGIGIYNTTEGSLSNGISLARRAGIDPKTKGMAKGHVPNFADPGASMGMGMMQFLLTLPMAAEGLKRLSISAGGGSKQFEAHAAKVKELTDAINQEKEKLKVAKQEIKDIGAKKAFGEKALKQGEKTGASPASMDKLRGIVEGLDKKEKELKEAFPKKKEASKAAISNIQAEINKETKKANIITPTIQKWLGGGVGYEQSKLGRFQGAGMGISVGVGMVGGIGSELAKGAGNAKLGSAIDGATEGLTMAAQAMATLPGPVGLTLAGFIGLKTAVNFVDKMALGFADELVKASDMKLKNLERVDNASNELARALSTYSEVSNNSSATAEQTRVAAQNYNKALLKMAAAGDKQLMAKLATAGTTQEKQAVLAEAASKRADEKAKAEMIKSMAPLAEKLKIKDEGWLGLNKMFGDRQNIFQAKHAGEGGGPEQLKALAEAAVSSGDIKKFANEMEKTGVISATSSKTLVDYAVRLKKFSEYQEKVNKDLDNRVGHIRAEQAALQRLQTAMRESQKSLETFAGAMANIQIKNLGDKIRQTAKAQRGDAEILAAKSSGPAFAKGGFISQGMSELQGVRNSLDLAGANMKASFAEVEANLVDNLSNIVVGDGSFEKAGGGDKAATKSLEAFKNSSQELKTIFQSFAESGKFAGSNSQAVVSELRSSILRRAGAVGVAGDKSTETMLRTMAQSLDSAKVQQAINQANKELHGKSVEELQKIAVASIEAKNKLQDIINQRELQVGGGISSFMQDFGAGKQQENRKAIAESSSRIPEVAARGSINVLKAATRDLGLGTDDKRLAPLMNKAIAGVEASIIKTQQSLGMGTNRALAREAAIKQVRNEVEMPSLEAIGMEQKAEQVKTNAFLEMIAKRTGTKRMTEEELRSGTGLQEFNRRFNVSEAKQQNMAIENAAGRMQATTFGLQQVAKALENIKIKIDNTYNVIVKSTEAGRQMRLNELQLNQIVDFLNNNETPAPKNPPNSTKTG